MSEGAQRSPGNPQPEAVDWNTWTPPDVAELQRLLENFEVERLIGRGGMGAVYLARQTSLDRWVAIKVLPLDLGGNCAAFVDRFRAEARTMAKLNHPAIVKVFDFGQTSDGHFYFVMEFVEGPNLLDVVIEQKGLQAEHALTVTAQLADALVYAHTHDVIHRDIKPGNILLDLEGKVKVMDFGLSKVLDARRSVVTVSNVAVGTPDFVAPEAFDPAIKVDGRADIYAVGVMLYNLLTGEIPRGLWQMPSVRMGTDPRIDAIIERCMQKDPALRYQNGIELRRDIDAIFDNPQPNAFEEEPAAALPAAPRRNHRKLAAAAGLAALALGGGWWAMSPATPNAEPAKPPAKTAGEIGTSDPVKETTPTTPPPMENIEFPDSAWALSSLDLLKAIELPIDAEPPTGAGESLWSRTGSAVQFGAGEKRSPGRLTAPFAVDGSVFEFGIAVQSAEEAPASRLFSLTGAGITVDFLTNGEIWLGDGEPKKIGQAPAFKKGAAQALSILMRQDASIGKGQIAVQCGGNRVGAWSGDLSEHPMKERVHPAHGGTPIPALVAHGPPLRVESWTLRMFTGATQALRGETWQNWLATAGKARLIPPEFAREGDGFRASSYAAALLGPRHSGQAIRVSYIPAAEDKAAAVQLMVRCAGRAMYRLTDVGGQWKCDRVAGDTGRAETLFSAPKRGAAEAEQTVDFRATGKQLSVWANGRLVGTADDEEYAEGRPAVSFTKGTLVKKIEWMPCGAESQPDNAVASGPPADAAAFGGSKYAHVPGPVTWDEAHSLARAAGGHLAVISNAEENDWIVRIFSPQLVNTYESIWLGAVATSNDGAFEWVTGDPITFTAWGEGEPNAHRMRGFQPPYHLCLIKPSNNRTGISWDDTQGNASGAVWTNRGFIIEWDGPEAESLTKRLAQVEAQFEAAYDRDVWTPYQNHAEDISDRYGVALERELADAAAEGAVNDAAALRRELDRLSQDVPVPPQDETGLPAVVAYWRNVYRTAMGDWPDGLRIKARTLYRTYDNTLTVLENQFLSQKRPDELARVRHVKAFVKQRAARMETQLAPPHRAGAIIP